MCLAIPGQITEIIDSRQAVVDFMGVRKRVATDLLAGLSVGDYVIVHAGFAISKLNEEDARETIKAFTELSKNSGRVPGPRDSR